MRVRTIEITVPRPLDAPWRALATNPGNDLSASHPNSNSVFRTSPQSERPDRRELVKRPGGLRTVLKVLGNRGANRVVTGAKRCIGIAPVLAWV